MPHVKRGTRQTPSRPRPLRRGLSAHLLREDRCGQPKAVAQRLSTIEKSVAEKHIQLREFHADAYAYIEAFENAEPILQPYLAIDNPYQVFLDDLREINREKSKK